MSSHSGSLRSASINSLFNTTTEPISNVKKNHAKIWFVASLCFTVLSVLTFCIDHSWNDHYSTHQEIRFISLTASGVGLMSSCISGIILGAPTKHELTEHDKEKSYLLA